MDNFYLFLNFLNNNIENNFTSFIVIYFFFLIVYNMFSLPGNIIFFTASGYLFGLFLGFLISIVSLVFGSLIFFIGSKFFLKKIFPVTYKKYSEKIHLYISNSSLEYLIIFRLIPGTPLILQNLFLSILKINIYKFLISSFIGFSPLIFTVVYIGTVIQNLSNIKDITFDDILTKNFLLFIAFIIIILLVRIFFKRKN